MNPELKKKLAANAKDNTVMNRETMDTLPDEDDPVMRRALKCNGAPAPRHLKPPASPLLLFLFDVRGVLRSLPLTPTPPHLPHHYTPQPLNAPRTHVRQCAQRAVTPSCTCGSNRLKPPPSDASWFHFLGCRF